MQARINTVELPEILAWLHAANSPYQKVWQCKYKQHFWHYHADQESICDSKFLSLFSLNSFIYPRLISSPLEVSGVKWSMTGPATVVSNGQ